MSDPPRLIDEGATEFEAKLLRAGRRDAPSTRGRRQILAGLGVGGLFSTLAVSTGAEASARGWLFAAGGGAVGALAIWAGVEMATEPAPSAVSPPRAAPAVAARRAPAPQPVEAAAPVVPPAAEESPAPVRATRSLPTTERKSDGLSGELAALDVARRALANGKPQQALRALDEYTRTFRERRLDAEAGVLRIEALFAAGETARARRLSEDFLRANPNGPYEKRVRSLIAESPR
jgi:hypothetical protein